MTETPIVVPFPDSPYCRVRAWVASIWADGPDDGTHPDWRPAAGEKVTLTPSIGSHLLTYDVAGPNPIIVTVERVDCVVGDDGFLAKPDGRPVYIAPTDDPLLSATGWTWTANIKGKSVPFAAPSGGVVDLAMFIAAPATDNTKVWIERIPELIDAAGGLVSIASVTTDAGDIVVTLSNGSTSRFPIPEGTPGPSAYDVAVAAGFVGSESAWLESLRGDDGQDSTVPGPPNSLSIGTVSEGPADASITGTAPEQTLHLTVPRGADGDDARPRYTALSSITASYTATLADEGALLLADSASPVTITLPSGMPVGGVIDITQAGAGSVTVAGTGVVCSGTPVTRAQWSTVTCVALAAGWLVAGDVVA